MTLPVNEITAAKHGWSYSTRYSIYSDAVRLNAPAILNAIYDAVGIDFYEIPITPDVMKKALQEKQ